MKKIVYTGLLTTLILSSMDVNAGGKAARQERRIARELATVGTTLPTSEIERLADATAHAPDAASRAKDVVNAEVAARILPADEADVARQNALQGNTQDVAAARLRAQNVKKKFGKLLTEGSLENLRQARREPGLRAGPINLYPEGEDDGGVLIPYADGGVGAGVGAGAGGEHVEVNHEAVIQQLIERLDNVASEYGFYPAPYVAAEAGQTVKDKEAEYLAAKEAFKGAAVFLKGKIQTLQSENTSSQDIVTRINEDLAGLDVKRETFNSAYDELKAADYADRVARGEPTGPAIAHGRRAEDEPTGGLSAGVGAAAYDPRPTAPASSSSSSGFRIPPNYVSPLDVSSSASTSETLRPATTTTTSSSGSGGSEDSVSEHSYRLGVGGGSSATAAPLHRGGSSPVPTFRTPPVAMQGTSGHSSALPTDSGSSSPSFGSPTTLTPMLAAAFTESSTPMAAATAGEGEDAELSEGSSGRASRSPSPTGRVSPTAGTRDDAGTSPRSTAPLRRSSLPTAGTTSSPSDETLAARIEASSQDMGRRRGASSTSGASTPATATGQGVKGSRGSAPRPKAVKPTPVETETLASTGLGGVSGGSTERKEDSTNS